MKVLFIEKILKYLLLESFIKELFDLRKKYKNEG